MGEAVQRVEAHSTLEVEDAIAWANAEGKAIAVEGAATKAQIAASSRIVQGTAHVRFSDPYEGP